MKVCVNYILINKRYTLADNIVRILLKCDNYLSLLKVIPDWNSRHFSTCIFCYTNMKCQPTLIFVKYYFIILQ